MSARLLSSTLGSTAIALVPACMGGDDRAMHSIIRALMAALMVAFIAIGTGCGEEDGRDPDAQQLARINKELAVLNARVDALSQRLERLETRSAKPGATPAEPAATTPAPAVTPNAPAEPAAAQSPGGS